MEQLLFWTRPHASDGTHYCSEEDLALACPRASLDGTGPEGRGGGDEESCDKPETRVHHLPELVKR